MIERTAIRSAFKQFSLKTCVSFVPKRTTDVDYVSIENSNTGCWSSVGRVGGKQIVNLQSPMCTDVLGVILHELTHAIGFIHEQSREDRDGYVKILMENVKPGIKCIWK